jgi:hypothetical protein
MTAYMTPLQPAEEKNKRPEVAWLEHPRSQKQRAYLHKPPPQLQRLLLKRWGLEVQ